MCEQHPWEMKLFPLTVRQTQRCLFLGAHVLRQGTAAAPTSPQHRFQRLLSPSGVPCGHQSLFWSTPEHSKEQAEGAGHQQRQQRLISGAGNVISAVFLKVPFFSRDAKAKSSLLVINKNPIFNILQGESSYPKGNDYIFL